MIKKIIKKRSTKKATTKKATTKKPVKKRKESVNPPIESVENGKKKVVIKLDMNEVQDICHALFEIGGEFLDKPAAFHPGFWRPFRERCEKLLKFFQSLSRVK